MNYKRPELEVVSGARNMKNNNKFEGYGSCGTAEAQYNDSLQQRGTTIEEELRLTTGVTKNNKAFRRFERTNERTEESRAERSKEQALKLCDERRISNL